jgi:hypothetical protein
LPYLLQAEEGAEGFGGRAGCAGQVQLLRWRREGGKEGGKEGGGEGGKEEDGVYFFWRDEDVSGGMGKDRKEGGRKKA